MNIQTDRALLPAGKAAVRYLTVAITAPARERRDERPPVHVSLVLDRSGSMGGRKIAMAKQAVDHAVRLLDERDRLAVVCFDTEIDTVLGATTATAEAKKLALTRLNAIDARSSTDLCGGWLRGAAELSSQQAQDDTTLRRVLLLSDGQANKGETNPDTLAGHAADLRAKGIATSTFGLGAGFDEVLMSRLATEGGGHFYFIEHPAQISDFFTSELGETLDVVARDVRLVVAGGPDVGVGCLNGFPIEHLNGARGPELHVRLGDLVSAQELTVVIEVRRPAGAAGDRAGVTVRLADREQVLFPQPMPVEWRVVDESADAAQPVSIEVLVEVATILAERARAAALEANRRGDFTRASAILEAAAADLLALASNSPEIKALAARLEAELGDFTAEMAPMMRKMHHFSSASALRSRDRTGKARKSSS